MNRILGAVRWVYNFLNGDPILITATALAFVLGFALTKVHGLPGAVPGVVFVALIVLGLATTLGRETLGRPRTR
jgi:hypothetical protein